MGVEADDRCNKFSIHWHLTAPLAAKFLEIVEYGQEAELKGGRLSGGGINGGGATTTK